MAKNVKISSAVQLEWVGLPGRAGDIAQLVLNRPEAANAFNAEMVEGILSQIRTIMARKETCRAVVLRAQGKHFCAGADLTWMKTSAELSEAENVTEADKLTDLFRALYRMPIPTIAMVQGACYGGGVGLVAACDWAIASPDARFCLSEVKLGVVAAVILPYLSQKIPTSALRRLVLTASVFGPQEALGWGLVQKVAQEDPKTILRQELNAVLVGAPQAQQVFKQLHQRLVEGDFADEKDLHSTLAQTISRMRASESGRHGMDCFFKKKQPDWVATLPEKI